ncbi:MAG: hypothetical protein SAK29_03480 [Scytonema sp. PMC 1069.18]|nr:hypothetical protein [Scytonema sp. PMC 1069.18]MEC4886231.1 hypothetical protein [Scytonema sp. PMC 1070.18]
MAITQTQIDQRLEILKTLLDDIAQLRQQASILENELAQAENEYNQKLSHLNTEADRLDALKISLQSRLAWRKTPPPVTENTSRTEVELPPPVIEPQLLPPLPPENPRIGRKRALADHIEYFLADSDRETVMQVINAVLADNYCDMGDMLELLVWGDIWKARAEWETLEEQYTRLQEWQCSLEERLAYWQQIWKDDSRYSLWQEKRSRSQEEWLAFLDDLAQKQAEENTRLSHEVAVLEQRWQAKQSENNEVKNV